MTYKKDRKKVKKTFKKSLQKEKNNAIKIPSPARETKKPSKKAKQVAGCLISR